MENKKLMTVLVGFALVALGAVLFIQYSQKDKSIPAPVNLVIPTPSPTPVSKPVPTTIERSQGTIRTLSAASITINAEGGTKTFNISRTKDFQKITSGTLAGGDAVTVPASSTDLRVGQEVLVVNNIGSTNANVVLIIK